MPTQTGSRSAQWRATSVVALIAVAAACSSAAAPAARIAQIVVLPDDAQVTSGAQLPFHAVAYDAAGRALLGLTLNWSSQNSSVAAVSSDGLVTGATPGQTLIAASADGVSGMARVDVAAQPTPPPPPPTGPPPSDPPPKKHKDPPPPPAPPPPPPPPDKGHKPHNDSAG
jgi:hypothetical protein